VLALILALAASAPAARAQEVCPPRPDVAVIDQYCEQPPAAAGTTPDSRVLIGDLLTTEQVRTLMEAGPEGAALLSLAVEAPTEAAVLDARRLVDPDLLLGAGRLGGDGEGPDAASSLEAVVAGAVPGGGLSPGVRWMIAASTIALLSAGWLRIRARI
jgi:hypothetical protein